MSSRRSQRSVAAKAEEAITAYADSPIDRMSRPRRTVSETVSTATLSRDPQVASSRSPQSMRLTVKTSSSKLREAIRSGSSVAGRSTSGNSRGSFVGGEILQGKRPRNVRKSYVLESDTDEEDDEGMEDVGDEDTEGDTVEEEEEDEDMEVEEDDDELGDEDADGDVDMDVPPPPPIIRVSKDQSAKSSIPAKSSGRMDQTVDKQKMEAASDDEELSELDSDIGDEVEEDEGMQTGNEEDVDGDEEEIEVEADDDEEDLDSDDETPGGGSRASTPDLNKLTKRQRARLEEGGSGHLLALPDGKEHALYHRTGLADTLSRGSSEEAPDCGGARHETRRNGTKEKES